MGWLRKSVFGSVLESFSKAIGLVLAVKCVCPAGLFGWEGVALLYNHWASINNQVRMHR